MSDYIKRLFTVADQRNNGIIDAADLEGLLYRSGFIFPSSVIAKVLEGTYTKGQTLKVVALCDLKIMYMLPA